MNFFVKARASISPTMGDVAGLIRDAMQPANWGAGNQPLFGAGDVSPPSLPTPVPAPAPVQASAPPSAPPQPPSPIDPLELSLPAASSVLATDAFRLVMVFVVTSLMLLFLNPPFVHAPRDKNQRRRNPLEAAPCSYGRVMFGALLIAAIVALIPMLIRNWGSISGAVSHARDWVAASAKSVKIGT